jgi:hypothetical protein
MDIYKVTIAVNGRNLEAFLKAGVMATIETGSLQNNVQTPNDKVNVIVGPAQQGMAAWVQVSRFDASRMLHVTHEGWISEGASTVGSLSTSGAAPTSLSIVRTPSPEVLKCQADVTFGMLSCCTSNGSGCYVKCCNGCCSDPVKCPGASCCP